MDNYAIADQLQLLSKLMDIHGENSFKAKSYATAAFSIEKLPQPIIDLSEEKIFKIKGIGESVGNKVMEIIKTGEFELLKTYLKNTPEGVLEMMNIKGLGPKKVHTLWKELGIENVEQLKKACLSNQLAETKGFGEKTQHNILEAIEFQQESKGLYLYAQAEALAAALEIKLKESFPDHQTTITGAFRRQMEIVDKLEWVTTIPKNKLITYLQHQDITVASQKDELLVGSLQDVLEIHFHLAQKESFYQLLFETSCSAEFLGAWQEETNWKKGENYKSEEAIFETVGSAYLLPALRESPAMVKKAKAHQVPAALIQTADIKGIIHTHSNWSDGAYTIDEMANECKRLGFEYLVISDHSKAAFYANGLSEQRIKEQHRYVDELNSKLAPFKIFKSIECDILNNGEMDYSNKILSTFDLVIASVHSNLQMDENKAMTRLMGAITNPYVTILGHMTGRVLLKRNGYPVDHKKIIDTCAERGVVIEINASPSRLDIDWRWIEYALEKNLMLSINPDAHSTDEMQLIRYGVLVAQKGGLTKTNNLSSLSRDEFEKFLLQRKR